MRRRDDLAGKDDSLLKMILCIAGGALGAVLGVHIGCADAAILVGLQALKGVNIQQHGAAHFVGFGEMRQDIIAICDAEGSKKLENNAAAFLSRCDVTGRGLQRFDIFEFIRADFLNFQIDKIC